jgi:hypothetical protein
MDGNSEVAGLLREIQRTLAEEADRSSRRWKAAVIAAVVCGIIAAPAVLDYLHGLLVRWF